MLILGDKITTVVHSPLIIFFTLAIPFLILIKGPGYNPTSASEIFITFSLYLLLILTFKKRLSRSQALFILGVLCYLTTQICLSFSSNSLIVAFESIILHDRYIPISIIMFNYFSRNKQRVLTDILIIMGAILAWQTLIKIIQNPVDLLKLYSASEGGYQRRSSIFPNTNMAGTYFTIILILFFPRIPVSKWYKTAVAYAFVAFPLLLSILMSFSRRAWLFLLLAAFIQFLLGTRRLKFIEYLFLLILILSISQIDFTAIIERFLLIFDGEYESNSLRAESSAQFYGLLRSSPELFLGGGGVGQFGPASISLTGDKFRQIDVYYVQLHLEFGLIGLLSYLSVFLVTFGFAIYYYLTNSISDECKDEYLSYIVAFLGLYFFALVGSTPITYPLNFIQWFIAGVLLSNHYRRSR